MRPETESDMPTVSLPIKRLGRGAWLLLVIVLAVLLVGCTQISIPDPEADPGSELSDETEDSGVGNAEQETPTQGDTKEVEATPPQQAVRDTQTVDQPSLQQPEIRASDSSRRWWDSEVLILVSLLVTLEAEVETVFSLIDANQDGRPVVWPLHSDTADLLVLARQRLNYARRAWSDSLFHERVGGPNGDPEVHALTRSVDQAVRELEQYLRRLDEAHQRGESRPEPPIPPGPLRELISQAHDMLAEHHWFADQPSNKVITSETDWSNLFNLGLHVQLLDETCYILSCAGVLTYVIGGDDTIDSRRRHAEFRGQAIIGNLYRLAELTDQPTPQTTLCRVAEPLSLRGLLLSSRNIHIDLAFNPNGGSSGYLLHDGYFEMSRTQDLYGVIVAECMVRGDNA